MRTVPHAALVATVETALARGALDDVAMPDLVARVGEMIRAGGLPLSRCLVAWKLIHPLYRAEDATWEAGERAGAGNRWRFGERDYQAWEHSPLRAFLASPDASWRRDLTDPAVRSSFRLFDELAAAGHTDYLITKVGFGGIDPGAIDDQALGVPGVVVSFASDAPGGFATADVDALERLRIMLALAARMAISRAMAEAIAVTYLGETAGRQVLAGAIRLDDGSFTPAAIWYADMRGSTALADRLEPQAYIALLNRWFAAVAGAARDAGGEILDFIGDAVLAIFPADDAGVAAAVGAAEEALARLEALRSEPALPDGGNLAGIAIARGTVMFGNVGIPERLSFSVIGSTVNRVARIEALTKVLGAPILATADVAQATGGRWRSRGAHPLPGLSESVELFALDPAGAGGAGADARAAAPPKAPGPGS